MLKKVHSSGATCIQFDTKLRQILTSGSDGKVTVWDSLDDEEQTKTYKIGGQPTCLALREDMFYTMNETGKALVSYSIEEGQYQELLTRFTAKITCITSNNTHVAAGASDFKIRVLSPSNDVCLISGHEAPVLSLSLAPKSGHLLSASCDGTVRLWICKTKCCLRTLNLLPKVSDISLSSSSCGMSWHSEGVEFAVPVDRLIHVYSRDHEELLYSLRDEVISAPINLCRYSEDGRVIAASTVDGLVLVWSCSTKAILFSQQTDSKAAITSLVWYSKDTILYADNQGCFGSLSFNSEPAETKMEKKPDSKLTSEEIADMFDESDDDNFMEMEAAEDGAEEYKDLVEEHEDEVKHSRKKSKSNTIEDEGDDDLASVMSDMAGSMATSVADQAPADTKPVVRTDVTQVPDTPLAGSLVTDEQEPFQPSSTPANHKSRYMVWNDVGIIRSFNGEDESTIDIEFHDTSRHHTIHLNNTEGYTMGSLSTDCALLATRDNGKGRSSLLCIYFGGEDKQQWSVTLDKHDTIECLCVGGDFVAVATSNHMIRGYTTGGFQLAPFLIPGAPMAMSAYKNVLMVAYHTAPALNGYQHLSVSILTMVGHREVLTHCSKLPLSADSTLEWLGFSCEGTPLMYGSNGFLSMYGIDGHDLWTPIINTKSKDKHGTYFIVSVAEVPPQIRCISCKGSSYPPTSIKPTMKILDYCIPLTGIDTDTGAQEELVWRHRLLSQASNNWLSAKSLDTTNYDKQEQTNLMKLFSAACREERLERAYQIAGLMSEVYIKLAAQYANRTHNVNLARKLQQLAQQKVLNDGEEESVFGIVQPTNGFSGYDRSHVTREDDDSADELTRFTAARFSTTPIKELSNSVKTSHGVSQQSPLIGREDGCVPVSGSKNARLTFANVLSQPQNSSEESQPSQDSQSGRTNPFKRTSDGAPKRLSINDLHKALDEKEQQKVELKKSLAQQQQVKAAKQSKLFEKNIKKKPKTGEKLDVDENSQQLPVKPVKKPKMSAFDVYRLEKCGGKSRSEAMDEFSTLTREEKKEYITKAEEANKDDIELSPTSKQNVENSEKRIKLDPVTADDKLVSEPTVATKKQTLVASENFKSKLAAFANDKQ